jgi:hypothetical protein
MDDELITEGAFTVPKYVRFARSLALVSGLSVGVAAGSTVFTASGCGQSCAGVCHVYGVAPAIDAGQDQNATKDSAPDGTPSDGMQADAGTSGGPLPAPPFPASWLA